MEIAGQYSTEIINYENIRPLWRPLLPELRGKCFEQWLINEIRAAIEYNSIEANLHSWRTTAGSEVDLVISKAEKPIAAIEIKAKKKIASRDLSGLKSFLDEYPNITHTVCVAEVDAPYSDGRIMILPWRHFLDKKLAKILDF